MTHDELIAEVRRLRAEFERLKTEVHPRWAPPAHTVYTALPVISDELRDQLREIWQSHTEVARVEPTTP